eukprot:341033-Hanusia_phi.AAC.1
MSVTPGMSLRRLTRTVGYCPRGPAGRGGVIGRSGDPSARSPPRGPADHSDHTVLTGYGLSRSLRPSEGTVLWYAVRPLYS